MNWCILLGSKCMDQGQRKGPGEHGGPGVPEKIELYILMQNFLIKKNTKLSRKKPHGLDLACQGVFASLVKARHCYDSVLRESGLGWGSVNSPPGPAGWGVGGCHQSSFLVHTTNLSSKLLGIQFPGSRESWVTRLFVLCLPPQNNHRVLRFI